MESVMQHSKINGVEYRKLIINAAQCLEDNKEEINELNVFPVPDGDTGSNMSMTVGHAAEELLKENEMSLGLTADKTARAMLHGARGNSGVIISLLFRGISKGLENCTECDGIAWANALDMGVDSAYNAVDKPAEGTILTVARKCADAAKEASLKYNNFQYVLCSAISAAEEALADTVKQNPVLEKAGVVDAGGKGWLLVMQSMLKALDTDKASYQKVSEKKEPGTKEKADFSSFDTEDIKYTYCTEFIVRKSDPDENTAKFKEYLNGIGDSLVMIDDGEIIKVHVHTNVPHEVLGKALEHGVYETVKVENMKVQHSTKVVEETNEEKPKKYGFVCVSNGDGINNMFRELGADMIVTGGQTMNPSTEDLLNAVNKVNAENVFILPNNKNIIMTAKQVCDLTDKNIIVIPTKTIPQGFSAMLGFDAESDSETNAENMIENLKNVDTLQITFAARNSNFGDMSIEEGDFLALYENRLLCADTDIDVLIKTLIAHAKHKDKKFISIYYGEDISEEQAKKTLELVNKELEGTDAQVELYNGGQPIYYYIISAE